jgi:hypothetical protein
VKRVLMIAFHYPPASISSGIQRTLKFSAYLPASGWEPSVLTVHPRAYAHVADDQLADIPPGIVVRRAWGCDAARHLSIRGRYPLLLGLPDKWSSWWIGGVQAGLAMIRSLKPDVLWSTYPIATAHLIGLTLHRLTGVPLVADFRDSMTEEHYPVQPTVRSVYRWIEKKIVHSASRVVFTSPGTLRMYGKRYEHVPASRWAVIGNGYDEANFQSAGSDATRARESAPVTLIHAGILYPAERDPSYFFDAIAELKAAGAISADRLRIRLRATRYDPLFRPELERRNIADIVSLEPPIGYEAALAEMLSASGLLIFQAADCNHQIPAKLYEYFRARRPVLALTDTRGDTATEMRLGGLTAIAPLDDTEKIKRTLLAFVSSIVAGTAAVAKDEAIEHSSRRARTVELARVLDSVVASR